SECEPLASVVVSSLPLGSPLYWYGACWSVHFLMPSIRKSTRTMPRPVAFASHVTEPLIVETFAIEFVRVTVGEGVGVGVALLTVAPTETRPSSLPDEP